MYLLNLLTYCFLSVSQSVVYATQQYYVCRTKLEEKTFTFNGYYVFEAKLT